jgi:SagB-type dehydrogenase family enzyme
VLYRRARPLIASWEHGSLTVTNYLKGSRLAVDAPALAMLQSLSTWRDEREIARDCGDLPRRVVKTTLARLRGAGLVERPRDAVSNAMEPWSDWMPAAACFHFGTKDVSYADGVACVRRAERRLLLERPPAPSRPRPSVTLPEYFTDGQFPDVLLARRTWRRFGARPLTLDQLSALLGLTWRTQKWRQLRDDLKVPLKTSPSGGACQSLEVYVVAARVTGLRQGIYSYLPDEHGLAKLPGRWPAKAWPSDLGKQAWTSGASALFLVSSVFPRVQWKYKTPRAYRTILLEAGHVCQTFCLVATWLGLAPFSTAAFADTAIERRLGLDGMHESLVYAMGVGTHG